MLLARHLLGLELPFILGRVFPVAAEVQHSAALVQSPQETLRSLTRPDVEVKFSRTMTYQLKGRGKFSCLWPIVFGWWWWWG